MDINATLIGQSLVFILLIWFTMRFVWPPLTRAMAERQKTIADGLAAAERGKRELELAEKRALEMLKKAKADAQEIIGLAEKRAAEVTDEAKGAARVEAERIVHAARGDIEQETNRAREMLRERLAELAVAGAARILEKEIDPKAHARLLEAVVKQL
ncbi:ATP synthase subunit B [Sulfurifustis variabilis]|uniref:ATP synthase subunit b n=1 Tax=Sulfurifustis variabilis TaxID=1675686 RepID=A0A1C7AG37_9GAMM|nr:F0F1 ATP synthase subunit B [Sulfurifustis variabilis]BAU50430.1 ATP synthase subunit B [Sulfurifustis variabilis]